MIFYILRNSAVNQVSQHARFSSGISALRECFCFCFCAVRTTSRVFPPGISDASSSRVHKKPANPELPPGKPLQNPYMWT